VNLDLLAAVVAAHPHLPDTKQPSSSREAKTSISSPSTPESLAPNQRTPTKPPPLPMPSSTHDIIPSVKVENTHDIEGSTTSSTSEPVSSPLLPVSPSTSASELSQQHKSKPPALSPNLITPEDDTPFHPTALSAIQRPPRKIFGKFGLRAARSSSREFLTNSS
jgi:hypothetical protein